MKYLPALLFISLVSLAHAGETAYTVRSTEIRKQPYSDAATISTLPEKSSVDILERKGGWVRISSKTGKGWVRMLSLRSSGEPARQGDSGLQSLVNIARSGSSGVTVATGIRGLDEEDIRNARPNPRELEKLDRYAANRADAERFARSAKLKSQQLEYLP